ncbi:ABC transporter ATP-binding protein [Oceanospirillum sediminis]|uniref:ABC transporter ATP-binding protein n=1 Tax=Oceanospirillum sediminis TaxID=2760088 RepID=A0A839INX2_9GAMM|nr:ABC transporter ATP-binding protein [Oceanospirillum sediminis]MBB1486199.1 ABC transporter ATP-binding protein [Oceanospirillum sediminis]
MFELHNIRIERNQRVILKLDQLSIDDKAFTVILGHNGSGKSTLMNLLARQLTPDQGEIAFQGQLLASLSQKMLARQIAFLPQRLPEVAGLTVRELVRQGRFPWRGTLGRWQKEDQQIITQAMQQTEVSAYADTLADQLSGGERQRAWIAMLLAQQSPVLLLDEPTSALDLSHQYDLMALLKQLNQETGRGVIVILHDLNLVSRFADQVIALKGGELFYQGAVHGSEQQQGRTQEQDTGFLNDELLTELYQVPVRLMNHPDNLHKVAVVC